MENSTSRIIIETVVKKTLRDIKDSPERSIRNLVDMALHFSDGRFQRSFFEIAQTMLENENSPYYDLIQDTVLNVDPERLLRFGMNLGYNSCTCGARTIREIEEKEKYNIPWTVSLGIDPKRFPDRMKRYSSVISQGEELGIYAWMLFPENNPQEVLPLVQAHRDSAFILFCRPGEITPTFLEPVSESDNLMLAVRYEEDAADACGLLREERLLYSAYYHYTEKDAQSITSGDLFCSMEQLHPVFAILLAASECPDTARETVYDAVKRARNCQLFQTVAWEATCDTSSVDSIISSEPCLAGFDSEGYLLTFREHRTEDCFNILQSDLADILKLAFPKSNMGGTTE